MDLEMDPWHGGGEGESGGENWVKGWQGRARRWLEGHSDAAYHAPAYHQPHVAWRIFFLTADVKSQEKSDNTKRFLDKVTVYHIGILGYWENVDAKYINLTPKHLPEYAQIPPWR